MQRARKREIGLKDSTAKIPWGHKYLSFVVPHKSSLRFVRQCQRTKLPLSLYLAIKMSFMMSRVFSSAFESVSVMLAKRH